jgi:hypothetical protein
MTLDLEAAIETAPAARRRILRAIAIVETSGGTNNVPRHEARWCPNMTGLRVCRVDHGGIHTVIGRGGANVNIVVRQRFRAYGCACCCSWGPWQIHYQTAADLGYQGAPWDLAPAGESIMWVLRRLAQIQTADPREIADAWNSGNYHDEIVPVGYIAQVKAAYDGLSV